MSQAAQRTRNWAIIVYPDSAPDGWMEKIDDLHTPALLSPLHDRDVDENGEIKKPHHHLLLMFEGVKTYQQVDEIAHSIGTQHPVKVQSLRGYARYLIHLDSPQKAQYSRDDIVSFAGADAVELLKPPAGARYEMISEMMEFVKTHCITEYCDLLEYAAKSRPDDWFQLLCDSSSYVLVQYIKSRRWKTIAEAQEGAKTWNSLIGVVEDDTSDDDDDEEIHDYDYLFEEEDDVETDAIGDS